MEEHDLTIEDEDWLPIESISGHGIVSWYNRLVHLENLTVQSTGNGMVIIRGLTDTT